jgi:hypothetical protein
VDINANHLGIFIMQFGATLVFKILSNFAFKNTSKNGKKTLHI